MIYMYAWEYVVRAGKEAEFLAAYGPEGAWEQLFRGSPGYLRTELHRDRGDGSRYVTLDYWDSAEAWSRFRKERSREFEELDERCEHLTVTEREIGRFEPVDGEKPG